MKRLAPVPGQTWKGWSPSDLLGAGFKARWVQDLNGDNVPCLKSMPDIILPNTGYCGLYQDDKARNGSEHQSGEYGRKARRGKRD
jgi:hypothetical protein